MSKYYKLCSHCEDGILEGNLDGKETTIECGECDGLGFHITDEGIELFKFLKLLKLIKN